MSSTAPRQQAPNLTDTPLGALHCITWNVCGLIESRRHNRLLALPSFTSASGPTPAPNLAFMLCTEVHYPPPSKQLPADSTAFPEMDLPGYEVFHSPRRTGARGGVCTYVRNDLCRYVTPWRPSTGDDLGGDLLWLRVELPGQAPILLGNVYLTPKGSPIKPFFSTRWEAFAASVREASTFGPILLGGDFNARLDPTNPDHDDRLTLDADDLPGHLPPLPPTTAWATARKTLDPGGPPEAGALLASICRDHGLLIYNGRTAGDIEGHLTFHHRNGQGASTVDYWIGSDELHRPSVQGLGPRLEVLTQLDHTSDHHPVLLTLPLATPPIPHMDSTADMPLEAPAPRLRPDLKPAYSDVLTQAIVEAGFDKVTGALSPARTSAETASLLVSILTESADKVSPPRPRPPGPPRQPWFTPACRLARTTYRRHCRQVREREQDPAARARLLRPLEHEYRSVLRAAEKTFSLAQHARLTQQAQTDPAGFAKSLRGPSSRTEPAVTLADFYTFYADLYGTPAGLPPPIHSAPDLPPQQQVHPQHITAGQLVAPFTPYMVTKAADKLRADAAADSHRVRPEFLQTLAHYDPTARQEDHDAGAGYPRAPLPLLCLTHLLNRFFRDGFPPQFASAHLVPLHKKGDRTRAENYRGIAIISILAKLYAILLNQRLTTTLELARARAVGQAGFRPQRSTAEQIWALHATIDSVRNPPKLVKGRDKVSTVKKADRLVYTCFVDFAKAFDCVPRELLWNRLRSLGLPDEFVSAVESYYSNVSLRVRTKAGYSRAFPSTMGVKQGCPLSPTLFGAYIDHFEELYHRDPTSREFLANNPANSFKPRILFYADDIVLIGYSPAELQHLLNRLEAFCASSAMTVNLAKTQVVVFRTQRTILPRRLQFTFGPHDAPLDMVDEYRYLGFTFHAWKHPGEHGFPIILTSATRAAGWLRSRCYALGIRDLQTCCRLFDAYVRPILFYAAETWAPYVPAIDSLFASAIERLHHNFLRAVLRLPPSAPIAPMLCDTGRLPLFPFLLRQLARFCSRMVSVCTARNYPIAGRLDSSDPERPRDYRHCLFLWAFDSPPTRLPDLFLRDCEGSSTLSWFYRMRHRFFPENSHSDGKDASRDHLMVPRTCDFHVKGLQAMRPNAVFTAAKRHCLAVIHSRITEAGTVHRHFASLWSPPPPGRPPLPSAYMVRSRSMGYRDRICRLRLGITTALSNTQQRYAGVASGLRSSCPCCTLPEVEDEGHFLLRCPAHTSVRTLYPMLFPPDAAPVVTLASLLNSEHYDSLGHFVFQLWRSRDDRLTPNRGAG